jgi:hypothetical protein
VCSRQIRMQLSHHAPSGPAGPPHRPQYGSGGLSVIMSSAPASTVFLGAGPVPTAGLVRFLGSDIRVTAIRGEFSLSSLSLSAKCFDLLAGLGGFQRQFQEMRFA